MVFVRSKLDRRFARFCRTGDPDALAFVFDHTAGRLLRVALWLCRHRADAEDVVQRTFLQAIALRERTEPVRKALPWLLGLLAHQVHRLRRERERRRREEGVLTADRTVDPEVEVVARELQDAVRAVRVRLSEPYRDVLELHLEQGLDAGEIAARLGRPAGTVRTQLVRALEMLRNKLPSGFVAGFAPLSLDDAGRFGAIRVCVVDVARCGAPATSPGAAAAVGFGVFLMANKLFVAVPLLLLVAGSGAYLRWSPPPSVSSVADASPSPPASAPVGAQEPQATIERIVVPGPAAAAAETPRIDPAPPTVAPWSARFRVIDADQRPVPDASITVWKARRQPVPNMPGLAPTPSDAYRYSGHFPEPFLELHTDAGGRAEQTFDIECIAAAARKSGIGFTGFVLLRGPKGAQQEMKLVLEAPVTLRGQVLAANGAPAAGARVVAKGTGFSALQHGEPEDPAPVTAGDDGRFAFSLQRGASYGLHAELHGDRTGGEWVPGITKDTEIVLRFGGGIRLTGVVVDPQGRLVGGASVGAWREYHPDDPAQEPRAWETASTVTDESGGFAIDVRHHARYQLIARAPGFANSAAVWAETTLQRPVATATLSLLRPGAIAGSVIREDGSPWPGARVEAVAETGHPTRSTVPNRRDRFAQPDWTQVGDDGKFAFAAHPDTTWRLTAWVGGGDTPMSVERAGVAAGDRDVVLRFCAADLAGCVVHGSVRRSDGQPLGDWRVVALPCDEGQLRRSKPLAVGIDNGSFTTPPLPLGRRVTLRVEPYDKDDPQRSFRGAVAPALSGPFVTSPSPPSFEFVLQPFGQLPVRVLTATGEVAHRVRVGARPSMDVGFSMRAVPVDADGRALLERCVPGTSRLSVWRDSSVVLGQDVIITPGLNHEVTIRLPAK